MADQSTPKRYKLLGKNNLFYESETRGQFGGNRSTKIYGRLDCPTALRLLKKDDIYAQFRIFFADEETAIAAGYRPCHSCMRERYNEWKKSGVPRSAEYPWKVLPKRDWSGAYPKDCKVTPIIA